MGQFGERPWSRSEQQNYARKIDQRIASLQSGLQTGGISEEPEDPVIIFFDLQDVIPDEYTGQAYKVVRVEPGESGLEFGALTGTTNQVIITPSATEHVFSLPQDIHTAATPTFAGMYLESASYAPFLKLTNESGTARDPIIQWALGASPVTKFTMGVDDSDTDDAFRIDKGDALGANLVFYSGNKNAIFGESSCSGIAMSDIENNIIIGYRTLQYSGSTPFVGDSNIIIGADAAMYAEGDCYDNVILGHSAIQYLSDFSYGNLVIGAYAGYGAGGGVTRSVMLGYYATSENDADNNIAIGANVMAGPGSDNCVIGRAYYDTDPGPVFVGLGIVPTYKLDIWHAGEVKAITSLIHIVNPITAADMDGTGVGVLFGLHAYESEGNDRYYDAAHIVAVAETDWLWTDDGFGENATIDTIDSYLAFYTTLNGVMTEKARVTSVGNFDIAGSYYINGVEVMGAGGFEPPLGNPGTDGWILSSTILGVRSWIAPGGGAVNFVDLADVPSSYVDQDGLFVRVNATEDGLEFAAVSGGGAPDDAQYIVGSADATLSAERVKSQLYNNYDLDDTPVSPDAMDDEFDDESINVKWTKVNDPSAPDALSESEYKGFVSVGLLEYTDVTAAFNTFIRLFQAPPAGNPVQTYIAKVAPGADGLAGTLDRGEWVEVGIYFGDPTGNDAVTIGTQLNDAAGDNTINRAQMWTWKTNATTAPTYDNYQIIPPTMMVWVKLEKATADAWTSANTYNGYMSLNGILWYHIGQAVFTFSNAPVEVGLYFRRPKSQGGSPKGYGIADCFRKIV
jgi:hypothetical protein